MLACQLLQGMAFDSAGGWRLGASGKSLWSAMLDPPNELPPTRPVSQLLADLRLEMSLSCISGGCSLAVVTHGRGPDPLATGKSLDCAGRYHPRCLIRRQASRRPGAGQPTARHLDRVPPNPGRVRQVRLQCPKEMADRGDSEHRVGLDPARMV
jgi:hypothetical protein